MITSAVLTWFFIPTHVKDLSQPTEPAKAQKVGWELLEQLNYKTGYAPPPVQELHGKRVRIPGFIVPLSDRLSVLKEFLLVPDPQACIHVPPPPPNLIVYVKLRKAIPYRNAFNPAWVTGNIRIFTTESQFGSASWHMLALKVERYKR